MAQSSFEKLQRDTLGGMTLKQFFSSQDNIDSIRSSSKLLILIVLPLILYILLLVFLFKRKKITAIIVSLLAPFVIFYIFITKIAYS